MEPLRIPLTVAPGDELGALHPALAGYHLAGTFIRPLMHHDGGWGGRRISRAELFTDRALILSVHHKKTTFVMKTGSRPRVCEMLRREYRNLCRLASEDTKRCVLPPRDLIDTGDVVALVAPAAASDFFDLLTELNTGRLTFSRDIVTDAWERLGRDASELLARCGLVHGDIKPENVVVTGVRRVAGADGVPRLTGLELALIDLGSSRAVGENVSIDDLGFTSGNASPATQRMFADWCNVRGRGKEGPAPGITVTSEMDRFALSAGAVTVAKVVAHARKIATFRAKKARQARLEWDAVRAPRKAPRSGRCESPERDQTVSPDPLRTPEKRRRSTD